MIASADAIGTLAESVSGGTAHDMLHLDPKDPFVTHPALTLASAFQSKVFPLVQSMGAVKLYEVVDLGRGKGTIGDYNVDYTLKASILVGAPTSRHLWGAEVACHWCPDVDLDDTCEHRVTLHDEPIRSCATREQLKTDGLPLCEPRPGERTTGPICYLKASARRTREIDRSKAPLLKLRDHPTDILVFAQIDGPSTACLPGDKTQADESVMTEQVESPPSCASDTPLPKLEQWNCCQYTDRDARLCQWATFEPSRGTGRTAGVTNRFAAISNFPRGIYLPC